MSASKEHFAIGGRTGWLDASRSRRCPVCESDSWCQIGAGAHAGTVLCKRVASTREKTNRDGVLYWVHALGAADVPKRIDVPELRDVWTAPVEVRDQAYNAVLSALRLSDAHRANLRARGLTDEAIRRGRYRSLAREGRAELARVIERAVGAHAMAAVPGIAREERDGRAWWTLRGAAGLVVPSRDLEGRIVALKVRADEHHEGSRYTAVSSRRFGGASAAVNVHVPLGARERWERKGVLWITEGELKADVCSSLFAQAIVGMPGVALWRAALAMVEQIQPRRVVVALDADWQDTDPKKAPVRVARERLVESLVSRGFDVHAISWPLCEGKGLDDYLLRLRGEGRCAA
jgi:hypothetical protein